jgi:hypothetical protein
LWICLVLETKDRVEGVIEFFVLQHLPAVVIHTETDHASVERAEHEVAQGRVRRRASKGRQRRRLRRRPAFHGRKNHGFPGTRRGMDVMKRGLTALPGRVDITSVPGKGFIFGDGRVALIFDRSDIIVPARQAPSLESGRIQRRSRE